jgi:1-deoxy-D-xylulose-5-phosphate reductoisomerase
VGGGCLPAVFNAANEEAVAAFVAGGLRFLDVTGVVDDTLSAADGWRTDPVSPADVAAAEDWARAYARGRVAAAAG